MLYVVATVERTVCHRLLLADKLKHSLKGHCDITT